jgi:hypothetical protein
MQCSMIKSNKKLIKKIIYEIHDYDKKKKLILFFFCSSEQWGNIKFPIKFPLFSSF